MEYNENPSDQEMEMYKLQIEAEFFESVEKGEDLRLYLYLPYIFLTEKIKEHLEDVRLQVAYVNLFEKDSDWEVYNDGYKVIVLHDPVEKKNLLEKMIEYYIRKEDYTKCSIIKEKLQTIN